MSAVYQRAANSYSSLELETSIAGASPQRLIVMLYDGALKAIFTAKAAMGRGDVAAKGEALSKAIAIIDEGLRASLDMEAGGEIAQNLAALYTYIATRLLYGNLKNDQASLDEAARLLSELKQAWEQIEQRERPPVAAQTPAEPVRRASVSFGKA